MTQHRVVITGLGLASPIGHSLDAVADTLEQGVSGVHVMPQWSEIGQLGTRVAGEIRDLVLEKRWPRKKARTMGRVASLAVYATEEAVADAGLTEAQLKHEMVGLAYGSTHGSSIAQEDFCRKLFNGNSFEGVASSTYLKFMSHTCAANLALFYGIRGRVISTCAACVSASQAIGTGYEAIRSGAQSIMLCGGAEELHFVHAGVFDMLYAASTRYNDKPQATPRPFDEARDGLVIGEGAGTVILESLEHARARGATIHAEILGYGTTCDGTHLTNPSIEGMARALEVALHDAGLSAGEIDYINAHATATTAGDIAESHATLRVLGNEVPISSTKGHTGHTLGACGAIEVIFCLAMMKRGFMVPTRNLVKLDPACAELDYVTEHVRTRTLDTLMSNNFAFGGLNTSLILRRL